MDRSLRERLVAFLLPYYQDLDGASRFDQVERIETIARRLCVPPPEQEREFQLLLLFHRLGTWLEKVGNLSRTVLATGVAETELRRTAASIRRLDDPRTDIERAVGAATLIDSSGVHGLIERFGRARREGSSLMDVVREAVSDTTAPDWIPPAAEEWLHQRREARREVCRRLLEELELADLE